MKAGNVGRHGHVLRLKIDMSSPNINLRDPVIIASPRDHHRTGENGGVFRVRLHALHLPTRLENITHSLLHVEFEAIARCTTGYWKSWRDSECSLRPDADKQYANSRRLNLS